MSSPPVTELGPVEPLVIQWLSGHGSGTPKDAGLGWPGRLAPTLPGASIRASLGKACQTLEYPAWPR